MRNKLMAAALALMAGASPALAVESIGGGGCASDLTLAAGSTLESCYGRFSGNVLNNANNPSINTALDALGYVGPDIVYSGVPVTQIIPLNGDNPFAPVNFPGLLNGIVFVGIHSGNGGPQGVGNMTAFYRINAVNLDSFTFNPSGASTATLFATVPSAVPEPATWAMFILGFGVIGSTMRAKRRRRSDADARPDNACVA